MENKNLNFKYLDHIDALRAISVILVIFYHINTEYFSLGYLGVDVFFVISGYVITNSIYDQQLNKNKSIFFFYVKRIKRIYPVLLLVILTFLLSYVIVSPLSGNTNFFLESAVAALAGLSNLYFINNEVNYFLNESINPLLHTWSLGVEEQFYFIYPIFIVSIFKLFKQNIEKIFLCIFLFILSSFLIYYFDTGIIGNFYFPIARFWELGLGCLAFFYPSIKDKYKKILNIFFVVALIVTIFNFENEKIIHNTNLLVTFITFFLIVNFRGIENTERNLIIKKTYLPYLGKLSYSLYLWHLPVLYFCEIYFYGIKFYFIFIITSLTLSVCSFHFFENPLRKSQNMEVFVGKFIKSLPIVGLVFVFVIYSMNEIGTEKIYNNLKAFN